MADGITPDATPSEPTKPEQSTGGGNLAAGGAQEAPKETKPVEVDEFEEFLKKKPFTFKTKDGKTVNISNRKELEHQAARGLGGDKTHQENKRLQAELAERDAFLKRLDDPKQAREIFRKAYGADWRKMAEEESLSAFEEDEKMKGIPPEMRARLEEAQRLKEKNAELENRQQESARQQQQREQQAQVAKIRAEVLEVGGAALVKAGFTKNPPASVINRLGAYMAEALDAGEELGDVPPEIIAEGIKRDMQEEHRMLVDSYVKAGDGAGLVAWLGEDVVKVLRKFDLARLRGAAAGQPAPSQPTNGIGRPRETTPPEASREALKKVWGAL